MPFETLFLFSNLVVMPFWLMMILMPHWRWTKRIMEPLWSVVIPALMYAGLLLTQLGGDLGALLNPSLPGIAAMLGQPQAALVAWIHFLTFDLFVGRWAYLDSRQRGMSAWLASPALFFVLMAGPLGFLLYLVLRWVWNRRHPAGDAARQGKETNSMVGGLN